MDPVRLTYDVPVPPAAAYYLFVEEIGLWWPGMYTHDPAHFRGMTIEAQVGGAVMSHFDSGPLVWGRVLAVSAPTSIRWQQWWRQMPEFPSTITVRFREIETGTRVCFEHGGWTPENVHARHRFLEWPVILANFVAHARAHSRGHSLAPRRLRGVA